MKRCLLLTDRQLGDYLWHLLGDLNELEMDSKDPGCSHCRSGNVLIYFRISVLTKEKFLENFTTIMHQTDSFCMIYIWYLFFAYFNKCILNTNKTGSGILQRVVNNEYH